MTHGQVPDSSDLQSKVDKWLSEEGYPLEFRTAEAFWRHGFRARQGEFVTDPETRKRREIDVIAQADRIYDRTIGLVRVAHIVECKWAQAKPWVVFTSERGHMHPAACVAQTIGSKCGSVALYIAAGDPRPHSTSFFSVPEHPGFSRKQAFSKGNDHFYDAVRSVVSASVAEAGSHDRRDAIRFLYVCFPTIVVDGKLFEAAFDPQKLEMVTKEVQHTRLHWRGADHWKFHSSIDVVAADHLDSFVKRRRTDLPVVLTVLSEAHAQIWNCRKKRSLRDLKLTDGPRGMIGMPPAVRDLIPLRRERARSSTKRPSRSRI